MSLPQSYLLPAVSLAALLVSASALAQEAAPAAPAPAADAAPAAAAPAAEAAPAAAAPAAEVAPAAPAVPSGGGSPSGSSWSQ